MNDIVPIQISGAGGSVSITVAVPNVPLSIGGAIWRFNADESFDKPIGGLNTTPTTLPIGSPGTVNSKIFMIEGGVMHPEDNRAVFYRVEVSVTQDGKVLHSEVPSDEGSGKISEEDISFLYRFQLLTT